MQEFLKDGDNKQGFHCDFGLLVLHFKLVSVTLFIT